MLPYIAAVFLGIGALGGLVLAISHLRGSHVALWPALLHAAAVLPGVALLFWTVVVHGRIQNRGSELFSQPHQVLMGVSLLLFLLAATGGAVLFYRHAMRWSMPPLLILGHGITALIAYTLLLIALVNAPDDVYAPQNVEIESPQSVHAPAGEPQVQPITLR